MDIKKKLYKETDDLKNFDFTDFWEESDYATKNYVCEQATPEIIEAIEKELGFKLPQSYINFMQKQNGGIPLKNVFYFDEEDEDGVYIHGFFGIGKEKNYTLDGLRGSRFWIEEWEYPNDGIYICDCPSGGHDMILLDYSKCGKNGEPEVVHIDQEGDYEKTFLAKDFAAFVCRLREEIDNSEEMMEYYTNKVLKGKFSKLLASLCQKFTEIPEIEKFIRNIAFKILKEKTHFSLHADDLSYLMYDIQFLLFSNAFEVKSAQQFLDKYEKILTLDGEFSTGGYAPDFVKDWLNKRITDKSIVETEGIYKFADDYRAKLMEKIKNEDIEE